MAAASVHRHSLQSPCVHISRASALSSAIQSVRLASQHANPLGLVMRVPWRRRVAVRSKDEDDGLALYEEELGLEEEQLGLEEEEEEEEKVVGSNNGVKVRRTFRLLGSQEKKELRAYAHQLGNDICMHQVGKWGLTANSITAISDALEANELVKIRVLDNLDEELGDTASQLEGKTGGQIVGKIGRTFLLYRPSMRKLKAAQEAEERAYKYQKRKTMLASRAKSSRSFPGASRGKR